MVKKIDVKAALSRSYKANGLKLSVTDYSLVRDVFHRGKTHACFNQMGVTHGKEKN